MYFLCIQFQLSISLQESNFLKQAIISIFKIPAIWFALFALFLNYYQVPISEHITTALNMGAYFFNYSTFHIWCLSL